MNAMQDEKFFLFIGSGDQESARSTLKSSGITYRKKMLESGPENWESINEILADRNLIGVLVKMTPQSCQNMLTPSYAVQATQFLERLSNLRHIVFMHESLLTGKLSLARQLLDDEEDAYREDWYRSQENFDPDDLKYIFQASMREMYLKPPRENDRERLQELFENYHISTLPYETNAELSTLAAEFIRENDKHLIFRVYIPNDRLGSSEADKLLRLFRDWLGRVKGNKVRQDGYSTPQGQVYEFFGTEELLGDGFSRELSQFSAFLDLCIDDPDSAINILDASNVPVEQRSTLVDRYAKEAKRVNKDLRQERERRLLAIRHRLEDDLEESDFDMGDLSHYIDQALPAETISSALLTAHDVYAGQADNNAKISVFVNQKIIGTVNGIIADEIRGNVHLTPQAKEILSLIQEFGGRNKGALESAVHELEDADANRASRITARQRLKGFLIKVGKQVSGPSMSILQKYVENKLGI